MSKPYRCQAENPETCRFHGAKSIQAKIDALFNKPSEEVFEDNYLRAFSGWNNTSNYNKEVAIFKSKLSDKHTSAIFSYVHEAFKFVNFILSQEEDFNRFNEYEQGIVSGLDDMFDKFGGTQSNPEKLYRGVRFKQATGQFQNIKAGKKIELKSFTSTSSNPFTASRFTEHDAPVILEFDKPKRGLPISFKGNPHSTEEEYLLPRNAKYKVTKVRKNVTWKFPNTSLSNTTRKNITVVTLQEI
jgi:hypothetical protein